MNLTCAHAGYQVAAFASHLKLLPSHLRTLFLICIACLSFKLNQHSCSMHNKFTPFKYFCANAIILIIAYIYCVNTLQCMAWATRKKSREYTGAMTLCIKILEEVLKQHGRQATKLRLSCWDIKILEEVLKQHGHQVTKLRLSCWDIKSWKRSWTNMGTRSWS